MYTEIPLYGLLVAEPHDGGVSFHWQFPKWFASLLMLGWRKRYRSRLVLVELLDGRRFMFEEPASFQRTNHLAVLGIWHEVVPALQENAECA